MKLYQLTTTAIITLVSIIGNPLESFSQKKFFIPPALGQNSWVNSPSRIEITKKTSLAEIDWMLRAMYNRRVYNAPVSEADKKAIIEDIEGQTTSMYNENQQNINMLRAIYNEEYDLNIDDYGNLSFIGDDGEIKLNDLPDYGIKDYETAKAMMDAGVKVYQLGYKTGVALTKENPQYFQTFLK